MDIDINNKRRRILLGADNNALLILISVILIMFVLLGAVYVIYQLSVTGSDESIVQAYYTDVLQYLQLPAARQFLSRPWTLLTYPFAFKDFSIFGLIGSVLWIWAYGYILQDLTGNRKLIPIFLYGVWAGAAGFLLLTALQPSSGYVLTGAGTGVMALVVATTVMAPQYRIYPMLNGGFPLWILSLVYFVVAFATVGRNSPAEAVAQLAAAAAGALFAVQLRKGKDWSHWMNALVEQVDDLFNPEKKRRHTETYKKDRQAFVKTSNLTENKLNELLEKIHQKGISALTKEEQDFLNRMSKK
jgi:membrane associated rhomboid family serine protease